MTLKNMAEHLIKTERLRIHTASLEEMEKFTAEQTDDILKTAYAEMLEGAVKHPDQWEWYAVWMTELSDGTHIGEMCFKGLNEDGSVEIGCGISQGYQGQGYAEEAVKAAVKWALGRPGVSCVTAETDAGNMPSLRLLQKCGFIRTGKNGKEGPVFICRTTGSLNR